MRGGLSIPPTHPPSFPARGPVASFQKRMNDRVGSHSPSTPETSIDGKSGRYLADFENLRFFGLSGLDFFRSMAISMRPYRTTLFAKEIR